MVLSKQCVDGAVALLVVNWLLLLLVWTDNRAASSSWNLFVCLWMCLLCTLCAGWWSAAGVW